MNKNYIDITNEWIKNATPNSHKVKEAIYFKSKDGIKYFVDRKNVVLDYSDKEKEIAYWLENTFGGEIFIIPRVNYPMGIKTPDFLFKNEYWDLKEINGISKNAIDNTLKRKKLQANNFIIDISNNILSTKILINQTKKIYQTVERKWLDKIMIIKNKKIIKIYKRN